MGVAVSLHLSSRVNRQLPSTSQGLKDRWIYCSKEDYISGQVTASLSYLLENSSQAASVALFISSPRRPPNWSDITECCRIHASAARCFTGSNMVGHGILDIIVCMRPPPPILGWVAFEMLPLQRVERTGAWGPPGTYLRTYQGMEVLYIAA